MDSLPAEAKPDIRDPEKGELQEFGEIEKEINLPNERSDAHRLNINDIIEISEEERDRKKQTEGRSQDETQYTPDITENAESEKQEENSSFASEKDQIQVPDVSRKAGKLLEGKRKHETENTKIVPNIKLSHDSQKAKPDEQEQSNEAQRLKEKNEQTGKKSNFKDKAQFSVQCSDSKGFYDIQQRLLNQTGLHLDDDHQRSYETTDDVSKAETQQRKSSNDANFHQDSPNVAESEERKLKDGKSPITGNSGRNKKDRGKKENQDNTERIEKDLVSQSKDRQAEEDNQAGKRVKQKAEYSKNPKHSFHDESAADIQRTYTGQKVHPSHESDSGVLSARKESVTLCEPLLPKQTISTSAFNVDPELETPQTREMIKNEKCSCQCTCVLL